MATTPEGAVKKVIRKYLDSLGAWVYMPMSNGMGRVGCPDFLVCHQGKFYAIEAKAPGKRSNTTPNQEREIAEIIAAGGRAIVADDVQQVKELFTRNHEQN